jgi:hypothetical protein
MEKSIRQYIKKHTTHLEVLSIDILPDGWYKCLVLGYNFKTKYEICLRSRRESVKVNRQLIIRDVVELAIFRNGKIIVVDERPVSIYS